MSAASSFSQDRPCREAILGHQVYNQAFDCIKEMLALAKAPRSHCHVLSCINAYSYNVARANRPFFEALEASDWLIPDGVGIVWASRILRGKIRQRVTGSDIFDGVMAGLHQQGGSVFFFGSTEETLQSIRRRVANDYPHIVVAGTYSPPFKSDYTQEELRMMVDTINAAAPDVLWVGLTAPKQELWLHQNRHLLLTKVAAGIGAVFDFYSGRVPRSHPLLQRMGMEWVSRLIRQPGRVLKRFPSIPILLAAVMRERVARTFSRDRRSQA
jgi:N-acetylglucosaminyldiphosphoundecaprenol N-acetyl-beta-D-mannosaminyltransferase